MTQLKSIFLFFMVLSLVHCSASRGSENEEPTTEIIEEVKNRTVILHYNISDYAKGTGLLLDDDGHVLTSKHVILGWEDRVRISQDSKSFYDAKVIVDEPKLDLVILKSNLKVRVPQLVMVDRSELKENQSVFLIGSPWGLGNSFLKGYIANTDRSGIDSLMPDIPLIQTMGTSYPGCSGAGVFLNDGRFIGINRATIGIESGNSSGLVIPSGYIKTFLKIIKKI